MCATGKSKVFDEKITSRNMGLIDLVREFSSVEITIDFLVQKCNFIMPRYYTIASSALKSPKSVRIAISLSKFEAPDGQMRLGATSLFLNMLQAQKEPQARIFIKESNFTLKNDVPILMVGPGTGVVPFIAFIEERQSLV